MSYVKAVLVEDEFATDYYQQILAKVDPSGLEIVSTSGLNQKETEAVIAEVDPDVVVVDLKVPGTSGTDIARSLLGLRPTQPIIFWSQFLADPNFANVRHEVSPLAPCDTLPKQIDSSSAESVYDNFFTPIMAMAEHSTRSRQLADELPPLSDGDNSPFFIPIGTYLKWDLSKRMSLHDRAHGVVGAFVREVFRHATAAWIIISGGPRRIVAWGEDINTCPDEGGLARVAAREGVVPFTFTRDVEVDSFYTTPVGQWSECPPNDFYPSITLDFDSTRLECHFDSGSPASFFSYEHLYSLGVVSEPTHFVTGKRFPDIPYRYTARTFEPILFDGHQSKTVRLPSQVVFGWNGSPFARLCQIGNCPDSELSAEGSPYLCGKRRGLVGRNLLTENRIALTLDGRRRQCFISYD